MPKYDSPPKKYPFLWEDLGSHLIHGFLGPLEFTPRAKTVFERLGYIIDWTNTELLSAEVKL